MRARSAAFLGVLWTPLLGHALGLEPRVVVWEQRELAKAPARPRDLATLTEFPRAFDAWWSDHFGFRSALLRLHSRVTVALFPDSRRLKKVVVGEDGWLFFAGDRRFDPARVRPARPGQAREVLGRRASWLAARGIRYLVVVVPDKSTVYEDHLPARERPEGSTAVDQLLRVSAGVANLDVLDLRPVLREARARERVYEVAGTHWNERGAFAAQRALLTAVGTRFPAVRPLEDRDVERYEEPEERGRELADLLGLGDLYPRESLRLRVIRPFALERTLEVAPSLPQRDPAHAPFALQQDRPDLPRAVVFRDSFGTRLIPFMATGFRRSTYYWQREFDGAAITAERPDLVVDEIVERNLNRLFDDPAVWEKGLAGVAREALQE